MLVPHSSKALSAETPCLPSPSHCTGYCLLAPVPRASTAMDGVLLDRDGQSMGISSYIFSPNIFSENNNKISRNCLSFQHALVKSKYQSKDVVNKEKLSAFITLQEVTPKTTQLEEIEHICDSRSQSSLWDPNWFHPFLCKIAPTRMGLAMHCQAAGDGLVKLETLKNE